MNIEAFAALTQEEQIERIAILGRAALREFGIEPTAMSPLIHAENTTYRVESPSGTFCLRVCRPGYQSEANVLSEIEFVGALRAAGFDVPSPYENRVVQVAVPEVPQARNCVLLSWQEGEFAKGALSVEQARAVGVAMAELHRFATDWQPPAGFDRQNVHAWAEGELTIERRLPFVSEEDHALLVRIAGESRAMLASLPRDRENFGIIHGDLHRGNVLFDGEVTRIIDFDDTCWAYWILDFAAALAYEMRFETYPGVEAAMLSGYESVRPLPPRTRELLQGFIRMRLLTIMNWAAERSDNPSMRETGPGWIVSLCAGVRDSLSRSGG